MQLVSDRSIFLAFALGAALMVGTVTFGQGQQRRAGRTLHVSPSGDDANPGTSDRPFRSIQKATDAAGPGDTVEIGAGTYREYVSLNRSGSYFGREITIRARSGAAVVIDPSGVTAPATAFQNGTRAVFDTNGQDHLIVRGLTVQNGGFCGISVSGSWQVRVEDCHTINTPGSGIIVDKSHDVEIAKCEVERACQAGGEESVSIKRSADVIFRDGHVHHTKHEGIDVKEGSKHVQVLNNHVHDVERQGLYADAWDSDTYDIRFDGNRVHDCMVGLVACTESGGLLRDVWFTNNLIYDCRGPGMLVAKWGNERMGHRIVNVYYLNNTVVNCGNGGQASNWGGGMLLENDQAENVVVMNNILSGSPQKQLQKDHLKLIPKGYTVANNLLDGPTEQFGTGNIVAAPNFVDPAKKDFRLAPNSKAINAGRPHPGIGAKDQSGKARIVGKSVDIGALER